LVGTAVAVGDGLVDGGLDAGVGSARVGQAGIDDVSSGRDALRALGALKTLETWSAGCTYGAINAVGPVRARGTSCTSWASQASEASRAEGTRRTSRTISAVRARGTSCAGQTSGAIGASGTNGASDARQTDGALSTGSTVNAIRARTCLPALAADDCLDKIGTTANEAVKTLGIHGYFKANCMNSAYGFGKSCECNWTQENYGAASGSSRTWKDGIIVPLCGMMEEPKGQGHRGNIESSEWKRMGSGVTWTSSGAGWCHEFGR